MISLHYFPHRRQRAVLSVSPEAFVTFLEAWAAYLSRGLGREVLAETEAA
jgi:hypothetical protein